MNFPRLISTVLGTGVWRLIRITVLAFTISAVIRLIPLPRRDASNPEATRRRALRATTVLCVAAVGVAGCSYAVATQKGSTAARRSTISGALATSHATAVARRPGLGVFVAGATSSWQPVAAWSQLTHTKPGLLTYYSGWGDPFQIRFARWAGHAGAVPFVQMEPGSVSLASIAAGRSDAYLRAWASAARTYGHPVALSFAPEANGPFYRWGCRHTTARAYKAAWRHVHEVVVGAGATNVIWVWDVNRIYASTCPLAARWPGPADVDWIGIDGYWRGPGDSYATTLAPTVRAVRVLAPGKPVLIAETGARRGPEAAGWIRSVLTGARRDGLIAVLWFNYADQLGDYKLQDNRPALNAYRKAAAKWWPQARAR